jgi:hypothetical protein
VKHFAEAFSTEHGLCYRFVQAQGGQPPVQTAGGLARAVPRTEWALALSVVVRGAREGTGGKHEGRYNIGLDSHRPSGSGVPSLLASRPGNVSCINSARTCSDLFGKPNATEVSVGTVYMRGSLESEETRSSNALAGTLTKGGLALSSPSAFAAASSGTTHADPSAFGPVFTGPAPQSVIPPGCPSYLYSDTSSLSFVCRLRDGSPSAIGVNGGGGRRRP